MNIISIYYHMPEITLTNSEQEIIDTYNNQNLFVRAIYGTPEAIEHETSFAPPSDDSILNDKNNHGLSLIPTYIHGVYNHRYIEHDRVWAEIKDDIHLLDRRQKEKYLLYLKESFDQRKLSEDLYLEIKEIIEKNKEIPQNLSTYPPAARRILHEYQMREIDKPIKLEYNEKISKSSSIISGKWSSGVFHNHGVTLVLNPEINTKIIIGQVDLATGNINKISNSGDLKEFRFNDLPIYETEEDYLQYRENSQFLNHEDYKRINEIIFVTELLDERKRQKLANLMVQAKEDGKVLTYSDLPADIRKELEAKAQNKNLAFFISDSILKESVSRKAANKIEFAGRYDEWDYQKSSFESRLELALAAFKLRKLGKPLFISHDPFHIEPVREEIMANVIDSIQQDMLNFERLAKDLSISQDQEVQSLIQDMQKRCQELKNNKEAILDAEKQWLKQEVKKSSSSVKSYVPEDCVNEEQSKSIQKPENSANNLMENNVTQPINGKQTPFKPSNYLKENTPGQFSSYADKLRAAATKRISSKTVSNYLKENTPGQFSSYADKLRAAATKRISSKTVRI